MAGELFGKGLCIDLIFGIPVGAAGVLVVQRTLSYGMKAGIVTGLGSSVADWLYACVGAFGLAAVSDFLSEHRVIINLFGGWLLLLLGLGTVRKKAETAVPDKALHKMSECFFSAFAIGLANPAAVLMLLFAFSYFGIHKKLMPAEGFMLSAGVFFGTMAWRVFLPGITSVFGRRLGKTGLYRVNRSFGLLLILFAANIIFRALI